MTYQRIPWTDYFCEPSINQLKAELTEDASRLFGAIRPKLTGMEGVTEKLKWFGDGWHWTIGYFTRNREDPLAVLIPNPTDLQLAMNVDREFINRLSNDQIKKSLREGGSPIGLPLFLWGISRRTP